MTEFFAVLSAIVVFASYPVYIIRIWQRKIIPNLASWIIFVVISVAFLLAYKSSGADENAWVTWGPVLGCSLVLAVTLFRSPEKSMTKTDIVCLVLGIISIVVWGFTRKNPELAQIALYVALLADLIGIIPSAIFLRKHPEKDRPAMWLIFSFGYFLTMFAITEHTFANWSLPVFMTIAPAMVWISLVKYRVKNKVPVKEWI